MQLRHLEVFHAIMLTGTITAAAKLLNISQPAATRLLLRAEDQLGYKLFDRVKGRLLPTREGQVLHAESERIISGLENLRKLSRNLGAATSGHLRIAAAPALCIDLVPLAISRFRQKHADVSFEVETRQYADLVRVVLNHEVDLGIGFDIQPHPGLDIQLLAEAQFYGIFPKTMENQVPASVKLDWFRKHPFIGLRSDDPLGAAFSAALKLSGVDLQPIVEVKTNQIALSLVARGAGVAIVDQYTAAAHDPRQVIARPLLPHIDFAVHVMRAKHQPASVLARKFGAVLAQTEKSVSAALVTPGKPQRT
ncbi:LysR substrate-binding domain-containing protein [Ferrovibrio sp.]|uniref:LysR family transcriptional regulator n=1 Tax=Ferrovibrio sp. TaxID=1917215 RepID=UPI002632BD0C|nr:LysR substrate-binding domain-containing protein [Ferrovibrio sp.]